MKRTLIFLLLAAISMGIYAQDFIVTKDAKKIEAIILEVSKSEIKYKEFDNQEGPTFILDVEDITSVTYSNGKVVLYSQPAPDTLSVNSSNHAELNIARVTSYSGIYVFTDCEPISAYEVIGEVSVTGFESSELQNSWGQYESVRNELVKSAKSANGQVEGVILTLVTGGVDKAHLIKFKNLSEDHSLARAKRYSGLYVFSDNEPIKKYDYLGSLKGKFTILPQYTTLRDNFIKKCTKKYKDASGVILHLVTGGKDTAEAIKF